MDDKTAKYLWALRKVNEALIEALKMAILVLEKEEELPEERKSGIAFWSFETELGRGWFPCEGFRGSKSRICLVIKRF